MADDKNTKDVEPNPPSGFLIFFIVTLVVTGLKIFMPGSSQYFDSIYILIIIVSQYLINLNLTKTLCYDTDYKLAFITTVFPWVMLFGVMNLMLSIFPGWLVPFSNTFGYFVISLMGSKDLVRKIFIDPNTEAAGNLSKPLSYIYSDQSLLINEVSTENFETFWTNSATLRNPDVTPDEKENFKKLIIVKDSISKCIWQLLTGGLITAISYNYILNSNCMPSAEQAKAESAAINSEREERENSNKNEQEYSNQPFV